MNEIRMQIQALRKMTTNQLQAEYLRVFGEDTSSRNRDFLVKRIGWRIQANAYGGLSERAKARAAEIADDGDIRIRSTKAFNVVHTVESAARTETVQIAPQRDSRIPGPGSMINRSFDMPTSWVHNHAQKA